MVELIRENPAKLDDLGYPELGKPPYLVSTSLALVGMFLNLFINIQNEPFLSRDLDMAKLDFTKKRLDRKFEHMEFGSSEK